MDLPVDHNFPEPILHCLKPWMGDIRLLPIRSIDDRLTRLDDRKLLIALRKLGFDGLVTLNYKMLLNPWEMAAVLKTKMTVFAVEGLGHDPLRATGALLLDLGASVKAMHPGKAGVFWMRPREPGLRDPWELFKGAAEKMNVDASELYDAVKVTDDEICSFKVLR